MKKNKPSISIFSVFITIVSISAFSYAVFYRIKNLPVENIAPSPPLQAEVITDNAESVVLGEKVEEPKKEVEQLAPPPQVTALSYIIYDIRKGEVAAESNSDLILPPASTTKIMTALVALEEYSISDVLPIPKGCLKLPGTQAYLSEGDFLSVESLLYALLLPSASDAACVLASGRNNPSEFLAKMNKKAGELGLKHTNFDNVIGLDSDSDSHYSTASDLLLIAKEALENQELMKIVGTKYYEVPSYDSARTYTVRNTNELLFSLPGTIGIKTGTTEKAGAGLVYAYKNTSKYKEAIIIVMGSREDSRFSDAKALLDWYLTL